MSDVIQSDRDAAMSMLNHAFRNAPGECMAEVEFDDIADAFAAHRVASEADLRANLDVAVEALRTADQRIAFMESANDELTGALLRLVDVSYEHHDCCNFYVPGPEEGTCRCDIGPAMASAREVLGIAAND